MKKLNLRISAGLGALIWALSPIITGRVEPWDAPSLVPFINYYSISLATCGFIAGLIFVRSFWLTPIGLILGQVVFMFIFLSTGPLIFMGIVFIVIYGLLTLVTAALGAGCGLAVRCITRKIDSEKST